MIKTDSHNSLNYLLENKEVARLAGSIAKEFANRNLFALKDFPQYIHSKHSAGLSRDCSDLFLLVRDDISHENNFSKLIDLDPRPQWISFALWHGKVNENYDIDKVAMYICINLIQQKQVGIDEHVENLSNCFLHKELKINIDGDFLTDLSDKHFDMRNHGIVLNNSTLVYPHQFFRRFYSSSFVGMPALLKKAINVGLKVHVRIDPLRKTMSKYYGEVWEFDYWHGPSFSNDLLENPHLNQRTVHYSRGIYCYGYDARYTVFRTKMMDKGIREFMIEEYCPLRLLRGERSPGVEDKYCIQKFAHVSYNQKSNKFVHLDGAIRVFEKEQYEDYFQKISNGRDVDEKIGVRHKMFLLEGEFDKDLTQEILTEWFRYNPHIQEYFSGENIDPMITYQKLENLG